MPVDVFAVLAKSNLEWLGPNTIYITRHGSWAYGTNIETSDEDFKGVAIPPAKYFHGFLNKFEQATFSAPNPDITIMDLRKFVALAADGNPSVIEVLWTDPSDHVVVTAIGRLLLEGRDLFLSRKVKHTFSGYAIGQLRRIQGHYRWLKNPPAAPPSRADYGLPERTVIPTDQLQAAHSQITKQLDKWSFKELENVDEPTRIAVVNSMAETLAELKIGLDERYVSAGRLLGFSDNFLELLDQERKYKIKQDDWKSYLNWQKNRNPQRSVLEEKWGYDCYTDDTEFLTDGGWKLFDAVAPSDMLATVTRKDFRLEYQKPTQRFDGLFNGNLHRFYGNHLETTVTPNHRMLYRKVERASGKEYQWELEEAAGVPDCFEFRTAIVPTTKNFYDGNYYKDQPLPPVAYAALMGWYISDGTMAFKRSKPVSVRISQKKGGKLSWKMARFAGDYGHKASMSLYEYDRAANGFNSKSIVERILCVHDSKVVARLYADCGHGSFAKRIPRWMFTQSKRVMEKLLFALIGGDGNVRPLGTYIYYSASKKLADDVQELAFMCGWETSLYGPYTSKGVAMYQVHLNDKAPATKRLIRSQNLSLVPVTDQRIVCFSVPNGTLVTRKNGHVAIQGNCKHAMHLVRLLRMAREILTSGSVLVRRPDRDELLAIRAGAWTYESLIEWAYAQDVELTALMATSVLPREPNRVALDALCQRMVEKTLER